ncbi:MAG: PIG-L family deacetylase, partial [Planctomycetes bacterium]|nr:PIG-L family deacetylase [Planctomycetota bacterium]
MRLLMAVGCGLALVAAAASQIPVAGPEVRSGVGLLATDQALRDVGADALVLLVASHPDDRYVLPMAWLRRSLGFRVDVLLASRGGGAQNSQGSESGDSLERIRTLEAVAGCRPYGVEVWHLNRPDLGYRRSADEAFAEWGRQATLLDLASMLRRIRPDAVMTTHHAEEQHGHDLALVELLPAAIRMAADTNFADGNEPHSIGMFLLGSGSMLTADAVRIDADRLDPGTGLSLRRLAYDVLSQAHRSPGAPAPIDTVFPRELRFEPQFPNKVPSTADRPLGLPSVFDAERWPGSAARAQGLETWLRRELPLRVRNGDDAVATEMVTVLAELRTLADVAQRADVRIRLQRRIASLEALLLAFVGVQFEVDVAPGVVAVAGESLDVSVRVLTVKGAPPPWRVEGLDGVTATLPDLDSPPFTTAERTTVVVQVPRGDSTGGGEDPMAARFQAERFVPPVRLRFLAAVEGTEVPVVLPIPVEQRAPVELQVVPRMLLLPSARASVQFSVGVVRNSQFPVEGELEVRGPAGYVVAQDRHSVSLRTQRSDRIAFDVAAPKDRVPGADVLRIRLGANRVELPVHKVDVAIPKDLRVGLLRSRDATLPEVLGVGGLGVAWSQLSDVDLAVAELSVYDSIVVDIRALRDRPAARSGFRRLLDFAA